MYQVDKILPRALNMITSFVSGKQVNVVVAERAKEPVTVVMEGTALFVQPQVAFYDVLMASRLFNYHYIIKKQYREESPPVKLIRKWMRKERKYLHRRFPALHGFKGSYHPHSDCEEYPCVVWQGVEFGNLQSNPFAGVGSENFSMVQVEGVDIVSSEDDMNALIAALKNGNVPLKKHKELHIPVAEIPANLLVKNAWPQEWERLERYFNSSWIKEWRKCMMRKMEGNLDLNIFAQHKSSGTRINMNRLYRVPLAKYTRQIPKIFQSERRRIETTFDPSQYLGVLAVDMNMWSEKDENGRYGSGNSELALVHILEQMGIDLILISFRDFLVDLGNGEKVYIHVPFVLKQAHEPMSKIIWSRVVEAWKRSGQRGEICSFQPIHFKTISEYINKAFAEKHYRYVYMMYYSRNDFGSQNDLFHARTIQSLENICQDMFARHDKTKWLMYGRIPYSLKNHAEKGVFRKFNDDFYLF
ncbi:hypothetical protein [Candidatus Uabimicrobium amorphum]|uniref:Uncharacterized protein n=1 Tax=Uabimicrobium amorphum TaxID=2596890 RepID=A0A5S9ISH7_UABAM|nr:hypothetical protein [Candidatus Uabimicrobium amorphum]BBM86602.1 hypothetical protein UABAM_04988 [Candidatus Uabimicrobium amorphum]